jgi:O-antigen/teichoic acid export membrane protein
VQTKEHLSTNDLQSIASRTVWPRLLNKIGGGRTPAALFDQGLVSAANFLTNILLARAFGVRDYGVFALAWIAVLFANSLQYALIVTPMMSVGPKQEPAERPSYYGSVLVHQIAFALLAAGVILIGVRLSAHFYPEWRISNLALPISGATLAYLLQDFLRRYFFCTRQSKRALITDIVSYLTQVPIIFWVAHKQMISLSRALWIIGATSLLSFFICITWYERIAVSAHSLSAVFRRNWRIARWIAPTAFMQWGAGNLFLLSAPVYYGAAASATLRAANNIVGVAHIWFLGLDNVVPAEAARQIRVAGVDGMLKYIKEVFLRWGGITLTFTSIIACVPAFWLRLTYGAKYASDGTVLRLYALLYLIVFVSGPLRAALQALEYTAPIFWAYPALIAFSAALAGPFARTLGLNGVIFGMCATQLIFQGIVGVALLLRVRKIHRQAALQTVAPELR